MRILTAAIAAAGLAALVVTRTGAAGSCEELQSLRLSNTAVTAVATVLAGGFQAPPGATSSVFGGLPSFCRASLVMKPTPDSDIRAEVWMPASGWNGKLQAVGNGGLAGSIPYGAMAAALADGYATSGTDTGHVGGRADFAQQRERFVDFAYRAIHEMTVQAKVIVAAFYNAQPRRSYFNGCSTGGRQALIEAQRFPSDYDGIVAGASAWDQMRLYAARIALNLTMNKDRDHVIPAGKYALIHDAVMKACDALDGVKDDVIEDPVRCRFDFRTLRCKGSDAPDCLTNGQIESAQLMTSSIKDPANGRVLLDGHLWPGTELAWNQIGGPQPSAESLEGVRKIVFRDPQWDYHSLQFSSDVDRAVKADDGLLTANDSNLRPFFARGGKLLMYHGWSDPLVTPQMSLTYYESVRRTVGPSAAASIELFMVPGMDHCRGGAGADVFDKIGVLDRWVESGERPTSIVASRIKNGRVDRTRPLCPYPQVAMYDKKGDPNRAESFSCRTD